MRSALPRREPAHARDPCCAAGGAADGALSPDDGQPPPPLVRAPQRRDAPSWQEAASRLTASSGCVLPPQGVCSLSLVASSPPQAQCGPPSPSPAPFPHPLPTFRRVRRSCRLCLWASGHGPKRARCAGSERGGHLL